MITVMNGFGGCMTRIIMRGCNGHMGRVIADIYEAFKGYVAFLKDC